MINSHSIYRLAKINQEAQIETDRLRFIDEDDEELKQSYKNALEENQEVLRDIVEYGKHNGYEYGNKYDPQQYFNRIETALYDVLRLGLKLEINNGKLKVINTVSEVESTEFDLSSFIKD